MRAGFGQFSQPSQEYLRFCAQFGATDVLLNSANLPGAGGRWQLHDLVKLRLTIEQYGLSLSALENVPISFYDHIMLGGPRARRAGREHDRHRAQHRPRRHPHIRLPLDAVHGVEDDAGAHPLRGRRHGLRLRRGPHYAPHHDREYTEEEMWGNLEYWIRIITPIAEEEGIRLGIHPCDPPVPVLGGIPQLLRSFDAYKRLVETYPSDSNGIEFCQGTFSEMEGEDIYEMIRYFGERRKILYVHFRNVSAQVPKFHEEFINTGYVDMHRAMTIYHEVGFDSFFIDDHVPQTFQDTEWGHRGRAFANGYIQAMIEAVTKSAG